MPDKPQGLTHGERQDVEELSAPRSPVIYEVVRQQGEDELCRPDGSLFWSGIAAGVTMMASVIAQGALRQNSQIYPGATRCPASAIASAF